MRRPAQLTALAALLVLSVVATACSDDSDESAEDDTPTADPPALNQAAVDEVQTLIDEINDLVTTIDADPTVIDDPDNEYLQRFRDLHTDQSTLPDNSIDAWESLAYYEYTQQPPDGEPHRESHIFDVRVSDPDTITFSFCLMLNSERITSSGNVEDDALWTQLGEGEAHRVDEAWLLHRLSYDEDTQRPYDDFTDVPPDACEESYVDQNHPDRATDDEETGS